MWLARGMKQKGFAPIIILLTVLVLFGIVGGMVYFKGKTNQLKSTEPQISPAPSTSQTKQISNWKTFQGQSFSFQYPDSWKFDPPTSTDHQLITTRHTNKTAGGDYTPGMGWLYFELTTDSPENIINRAAGVDKKEQTVINGYPATRLTGYEGVAGSVYFVKIIIPNGKKTFIMNLSTQDVDLEKPLTAELDQILSTFRFSVN